MPNPEIFLKDFMHDIEHLHSNPISCHQVKFDMAGKGIFVCDAPARSALKNIKSHNAYNSVNVAQ